MLAVFAEFEREVLRFTRPVVCANRSSPKGREAGIQTGISWTRISWTDGSDTFVDRFGGVLNPQSSTSVCPRNPSQTRLSDGGCVRRESHAQFCERLAV